MVAIQHVVVRKLIWTVVVILIGIWKPISEIDIRRTNT
jgi:hypothetical protein